MQEVGPLQGRVSIEVGESRAGYRQCRAWSITEGEQGPHQRADAAPIISDTTAAAPSQPALNQGQVRQRHVGKTVTGQRSIRAGTSPGAVRMAPLLVTFA